MKGGVVLFRGAGLDALRYLESDRSRADEYYLQGGTAVAEFAAVDGQGRVVAERALSPEGYRAWVDWVDPLTGLSMGRPRLRGAGRGGSPRFSEMVVNVPKSLSIAAALHPAVSTALDAAQRDTVAEIRSWLGAHSVTRVGPRGRQEVVPVEQLQTVAVSHKTSRAGDPHRHIHFQIGTRAWAAGAWRGLDTAALFRQQGAIRALGTAVLAAHPALSAVLDAHGLSLNPVTGEVAELVPWNEVMSKRGAQVARNLERFTAEWRQTHPGVEPGPVVRARLQAAAWDHGRPSKKPTRLGSEAGWVRELVEAGYRPDMPRVSLSPAVSLDELQVQQVASRALDRCAARASAWTVHDIQEHATRIVTETGVRATPQELAGFITITTRLAEGDCLSILPPGAPTPEHVVHLTALQVVAVEAKLRDRLAARASRQADPVLSRIDGPGLDAGQVEAATAIAGTAPLIVVEGAAGAGKTTMLGAAIRAAEDGGRRVRVVTPTKKAADVAAIELGVESGSVAALVYAHGFRWNRDGVWSRLKIGEVDPATGTIYRGPTPQARLAAGDRIVVDEAGMLDQDTALALVTVADEAGATLALVGDRAQLPAVGRGGVLDIAAGLARQVHDMDGVHRFTDPTYAALTLDLRTGRDAGQLFNRLNTLGLIQLHPDADAMRAAIAASQVDGAAITTATNEEARELNTVIRADRIRAGLVDDTRTTIGADGLAIGAGDVIQTRRNDPHLAVANRQTWTVQQVDRNGGLWVRGSSDGQQSRSRYLPAPYVAAHTHLAYAATAYGVQGVTTPESHTVLSDGLDEAGLYVGLTRGREANRLHIIAADTADAREQFIAATGRDRADRGLVDATARAAETITGLVSDGPVAVVNTERARLNQQIEYAEQQAATWEQASAALADLARQHQREQDEHAATIKAAENRQRQMRKQITGPLIAQASADGAAVTTAQARVWELSEHHRGSRGLRKHGLSRALAAAIDEHQELQAVVRRRWGSIPIGPASVTAWAEIVANRQADTDPRIAAQQALAETARREYQDLVTRHVREQRDLERNLNGGAAAGNPDRRASEWQRRAATARRKLAAIEALPVTNAARLIKEHAAQHRARPEVTGRTAAEQNVCGRIRVRLPAHQGPTGPAIER